MSVTVRVRTPAARDSRNFVRRYLDELIDYGGELCTRADAIADMERLGLTRAESDRWLQGYELAQRRRARRAELRLFLEQVS